MSNQTNESGDQAKNDSIHPRPDPSTSATPALRMAAIFAVILITIFTIRVVMLVHHRSQLAKASETDAGQPPAVDVVKVVRANSAGIIDLPGSASPFYETTIFARTSGYLKDWKHDIGDRVKSGELLAVIETPELDDQLRAAQAKVLELEAGVKLAQAGASFAKISYNRWNASAPEGVVSQQEKDEKKADLDSSTAHVDEAKAILQSGQEEVRRLETLEGFKNVTAPFDGVITERQVDIGDLVTAGSTASTTPLFHIAQYDKVRVFVEIPQAISGEIYDGMPVSAFAPETPAKVYHGIVDRTAGAIDPTGRMLRVEALIDNPDLALLPGTYLQVEFKTDRKSPPLQIPAAAMTMRPQGPEAAVVDEDGIVKFHPIHIEKDMGDVLEINQGLSDGDTVALNVGEDIVDGSHVTPNKTDEPTHAVVASGEK